MNAKEQTESQSTPTPITSIVPDFPNYTAVSSGTVFNNITKQEAPFKIDPNGYIVVTLTHGDVVKDVPLHRIIGTLFLPNPDGKKQISFIDGDKSICHVNNLMYGVKKGSPHKNHGLKPPTNTKVSTRVLAFNKDGTLKGDYANIDKAAEKLKMPRTNIQKCLRGGQFRNINGEIKWLPQTHSGGYHFEYKANYEARININSSNTIIKQKPLLQTSKPELFEAPKANSIVMIGGGINNLFPTPNPIGSISVQKVEVIDVPYMNTPKKPDFAKLVEFAKIQNAYYHYKASLKSLTDTEISHWGILKAAMNDAQI